MDTRQVSTRDNARTGSAPERAEFTHPPAASEHPTLPLRGGGGEIDALRLDVDSHLSPVGLDPHPALRAEALQDHVGVPTRTRAARAAAGLEVIRLDVDLDMWVWADAARHCPINPAASVAARAFGVHAEVYGPVVFTGTPQGPGITGDVSVAATVLLAGLAAACEPGPPLPEQRAGERAGECYEQRAQWRGQRRTEWARLGITVASEWDAIQAGPVSFDSLRWTVQADGDVERCVECGEPGSHEQHQPEVLAESATGAQLGEGTR